jgi:pimeloyl-ACP methyl ester carboxylesterase
MQVPELIIRHGMFPMMWKYKDGLPHLQGRGVGKGPIIAEGAGHMIHIDAPDIVARELLELIVTSHQVVESRF